MTEPESRKKKRRIFSSEDSIICKGCHKLHDLDDIAIQMRGITFPKGNLSVYRIGCPETNEFYEYPYEDIMSPVSKLEERRKALGSADSDSESRFKAIEARLSWLESGRWIEDKKQELEDFCRHFLTQNAKGQSKDEKKEVKVAYTT